MDQNFLESHHVVNVGDSNFIAANEDIFNGDPASDVVSLKNWDRCTFILAKGAGAIGTATLTVESCSAADGTGATAVAFQYRKATSGDTFGAWADATAAGVTTTAGADQVYEVSVKADGLEDDHSFVRLQMTEVVDGPCDGGLVALLTGPRYAQSIPASVLS